MTKQRRDAGRGEVDLPPRFRFFRQELEFNVEEVYRRLKDVATLTQEELKDKHRVSAAINVAARNAIDARKLFLVARRERELFRIEKHRSMRRMTREATERITRWMEMHGVKKKQITNDMVKEQIAADKDLREEYEILVRRELDLKDIRDTMQALADEWKERKSTLQTQAGLLKAQREVVF